MLEVVYKKKWFVMDDIVIIVDEEICIRFVDIIYVLEFVVDGDDID